MPKALKCMHAHRSTHTYSHTCTQVRAARGGAGSAAITMKGSGSVVDSSIAASLRQGGISSGGTKARSKGTRAGSSGASSKAKEGGSGKKASSRTTSAQPQKSAMPAPGVAAAAADASQCTGWLAAAGRGPSMTADRCLQCVCVCVHACAHVWERVCVCALMDMRLEAVLSAQLRLRWLRYGP